MGEAKGAVEGGWEKEGKSREGGKEWVGVGTAGGLSAGWVGTWGVGGWVGGEGLSGGPLGYQVDRRAIRWTLGALRWTVGLSGGP